MKDNFDLYSWNKNRYLNKENKPKMVEEKDFDLREWNKKRYLGELDINTMGGETNVDNVDVTHGGDDPKIGAEEESDANVVGENKSNQEQSLEKEIKSKFGSGMDGVDVSLGEYSGDRQDSDPLKGKGYGKITVYQKEDVPMNIWKQLEDLVKSKGYEITNSGNWYDSEPGERDIYPSMKFNFNLNNITELNPIEETIKFIMDDLEGYSNYFPGGKTKGLTSDEMSTILMQIVKDIEDDGKQLDESNLCKRGQNYLAARKRAGEKSSAYLSGRAVKVCKGQIKGSDGKNKKSFKNESLDEYVDNGPEEKAFDVEMDKAGKGIASAIEKELKDKKPQELNEAIITSVIAGILTGNSIINFISKLAKLLFKKIGFKKGEDIAGKIHHWAHDNEVAFQAPIKRVLKFFIKDTKTLDIVTKGIYAIVVGSMAANYGAEALSSLSKSDWFSTSLNALKTLAKSDETIVNAYPAIKALI
jgi:hypothetical protein